MDSFVFNIITKTTRWEVVKQSASPKRPFFLFCVIFSSIFGAFPVQILGKHSYLSYISLTQICLFHFFSLRPSPPLIQRGGTLYIHIHFPIGTRPHLAQKGGGGHVPEMPPPPKSTYNLSLLALTISVLSNSPPLGNVRVKNDNLHKFVLNLNISVVMVICIALILQC